jgi:hypothetical protein
MACLTRALARLKDAEEVGNSRKRPRGYYLLDHAPLFDQPPRRARKTA